ncbi:Hint domain-containing protein [Methylobacterium nodulans]|uniref:Hedgehog/Intein (Hint) domain-containing protein n=1 Tax=Methylobacterium nodulans (strain LMG 21967 / CNCM I-2342 / ORS 2060) TaxID=460265 RepID=B8IUH9_METNO|nr:Hint domain-containing protein [Methylobacterium nodulans]ACL57047.1 hypothetical protein Mnod_2062 [Methylobacterium nodulans ORS 2060]
MATPIVFNDVFYPAGNLGQDVDRQSATQFTVNNNAPQDYSVRGTVNQVNDAVSFTSRDGTDAITVYVTNFDDADHIVFTEQPNGIGPAYIISNTPLSPGNTLTFSETNVGDYHVPCYMTGTLIRTTRGDVAVEELAIGDIVVTAAGLERPIRWIGHRAYTGRFANANPDVLPICFKAGSLADGTPARDLWVSPKHAMFLDGCLIPAVHLVNGVTITTAERVDSVEYWHVELDRHDVLLAEGAPSESFVDDHSRGMFHNAHTFAQLYPDTPPQEAIYCAPRVESGYVLEAARRRLAERAGLPVPAARVFGPLRGSIDRCDTDAQGGVTVVGWAQDLAHPDGPVCLDVVIDGTVVAQAFAERYRADLEGIGIGDGRHAFSLTLPEALTQHGPHTIEVRRSADGAPIAAALQVAAPERHAA